MKLRKSIPAFLLAVLAAAYLGLRALGGGGEGRPIGGEPVRGDAPGEPARAAGPYASPGGNAPPGGPGAAPASGGRFTNGDRATPPGPVGPPGATGRPPGGPGEAVDPAEAAEAERISEAMRKLVRDLEYTKGLPEPPQQAVVPQPEPWRASPDREGPPPEIAAVAPVRGRVAGGERVEIRGRNLRVVSVMFGTSPARLLEASGGLVAVEAPPGSAGPVTVAVTNDDGTWGVAPQPYVYGE